MTSRFIPFQFKETKVSAPVESPNKGQEFAPPEFEVHVTQTVSHVAHNIRASKFALNPMVADAIGVEAEEKSRREEMMKVELEKRWEILKERSEVQGFQKGLEQGKHDAYLSERPRIEEKLQRLENVINEISGMREKIFAANEKFLMDLIANVMQTVLLREVELDRDYLKRVIVAILNQTGAREDIRILISEQDRNLIEGLQMILEKEYGKLNNTVIEISSDIAPSGCKVETRFGVVDASLQTQIKSIVETLRNA